MKLLFDQNISNRIIPKLLEEFTSISHIKIEGLTDATDYEIFMYARQENYEGVVSRDDDFVKLVRQFGTPPKVIYLRTGNANTETIAQILIEQKSAIQDFLYDDLQTCLTIFKD
jgi:predicted nuclease of predicted toxin-antitoxin system